MKYLFFCLCEGADAVFSLFQIYCLDCCKTVLFLFVFSLLQMYCLNSSNIVVFLFVQNCWIFIFVVSSVLFGSSNIALFMFVQNGCICIFVVANVLFGLLQNCRWQQAAAVNGSPKIPNKYQYFKIIHRLSQHTVVIITTPKYWN